MSTSGIPTEGQDDRREPTPDAAHAELLGIRNAITPVLSLVAGAIVLMPAAVGTLKPPHIWPVLVPLFFGLAALSFICLVVAYIRAAWQLSMPWTRRLHGFGNVVAILTLGILVAFMIANFDDDLFSDPKLLNIKVNPVTPEVSKMTEVDVEVLNQSGRPLTYQWAFNDQKLDGTRTAYLRMPDKPGRYRVSVSISDGRGSHVAADVWLDVTASEASKPDAATSSPASSAPTVIQICNGGANGATRIRKHSGASAPNGNSAGNRPSCR